MRIMKYKLLTRELLLFYHTSPVLSPVTGLSIFKFCPDCSESLIDATGNNE